METEGKLPAREGGGVEPAGVEATQPAEADAAESAPAWQAITRAVALFFGAFSLLNLLGEFRSPGFDANLWWIDLGGCPAPLARGLLALFGVLLLWYAVRPGMAGLLRWLTLSVVMLLFGVALRNSFVYYGLLRQGVIRSESALPFSLHVAASLAVIATGLVSKPGRSSRPGRDLLIGSVTLAVCLVGFPLAQMYCFGKTDYRRPAHVIVVFGCRAYADGRPSAALDERVRSGCRLYLDGLADKIIFSGGPGDGEVHETESMRRIAVGLGVPQADIILDRDGLNTQATVENTAQIFADRDFSRILAVSHFYHLPRIKLCYRRSHLDVYTVPAEQQHPPADLGYRLMREVAALWLYYLHPLAVPVVEP